jgi:hypothetical protein
MSDRNLNGLNLPPTVVNLFGYIWQMGHSRVELSHPALGRIGSRGNTAPAMSPREACRP